jgi:hypothetical protein
VVFLTAYLRRGLYEWLKEFMFLLSEKQPELLTSGFCRISFGGVINVRGYYVAVFIFLI